MANTECVRCQYQAECVNVGEFKDDDCLQFKPEAEKTWTILLIGIGRNKISWKVNVKFTNLLDILERALTEVRKHLMSKDVELVKLSDNRYRVEAGFHSVGFIKIIERAV